MSDRITVEPGESIIVGIKDGDKLESIEIEMECSKNGCSEMIKKTLVPHNGVVEIRDSYCEAHYKKNIFKIILEMRLIIYILGVFLTTVIMIVDIRFLTAFVLSFCLFYFLLDVWKAFK